MFAIVDVGGQQVKVHPSARVCIPKLSSNVGDTVTFDNIILLADEKDVRIGTPFIDGASVEAKVLGHLKDDKVVVFKKKKRKGYRVSRGHRQQYTEIEITSIQ